MMASIPCAETSWDCISGASEMIASCSSINNSTVTLVHYESHQLITSFTQLKIGGRRSQLVDEQVDTVAQPCILVTLEVGL